MRKLFARSRQKQDKRLDKSESHNVVNSIANSSSASSPFRGGIAISSSDGSDGSPESISTTATSAQGPDNQPITVNNGSDDSKRTSASEHTSEFPEREVEDNQDEKDFDIDWDQLPTSHHQRILFIDDLLRETVLECDHTYYLISSTWWDRFNDDPYNSVKDLELEQKPNSILPVEYAENLDEEGKVIPVSVHKILTYWYGFKGPLRKHRAIEVGDDEEQRLILETYKPTLYLYPMGNVDGFKEIRVMESVSLSSSIEEIRNSLELKDIRLWQMTNGTPEHLPLTIAEFRKQTSSNLLEPEKRLYHYTIGPIEHIAVEQKSPIGWMSKAVTPQKTYVPPGTCGLANLGNSCYMNSALQCLMHVEELASYFISKYYERDLNCSNPIGYKGQVAQSFGNLVESTFFSKMPSFAPRSFKHTVGKYDPAFAGFVQQDSQEFLAFLLDGLHEDLNRVIDKPVTEWPELSDDQVWDQKKMHQLAEECWTLHKMRNESAVMDLFCGLYRSTLVCPECTKASVTFDPFMDLTLPLPNDNLWVKEIEVVPKDGQVKLLEIGIDRHSTIRQLKDYVASRLGLENSMRLISSEVYNHRFYKHHENWALVSEKIGMDDHIIVYELDRQLDKAHDEENEKPEGEQVFGVPVFNRVKGDCCDDWKLHEGDFFGTPFFITLTEQESQDEDLIMKKIMAHFEGEDIPKLSYVENKRVDEDPMTGWNISHNMVISFAVRAPGATIEVLQEGNIDAEGREEEEEENILRGPVRHGTNDTTNGQIRKDTESTNSKLVSLLDDKAEYNTVEKRSITHVGSGQYVYRGEGIVCDWNARFAKGEIEKLENPELDGLRQGREEMKLNGITLDDCLDLFAKAEVLSKDDLWYCSKCKVLRQATKTIDLWKVPEIFTIHLKRFASFRSFRDKLDDVVQFPLEGLDFTKRVACSNGEELIYDLIAVDNHFGGLGGGHYTAYAKNFCDGKWYYYDDAQVKEVNPNNCITNSAYLLFYRKRCDKPLGGDVLQKAVEEARKRVKEFSEPIPPPVPEGSPIETQSSRSSILLSTSFPSQISLAALNHCEEPSNGFVRRATTTSFSSARSHRVNGYMNSKPLLTIGSDGDEASDK